MLRSIRYGSYGQRTDWRAREITGGALWAPAIESELARIASRYELETDEGGTAREKALEIWKVGRQ